MSGESTILHADLDAFYASVEQRDDPKLRGRPVIVGGGVVLAASYEARAFGVRSAMGGGVARRLCPQAVVVRPRWEAYVEASRRVFGVFERTSPVVEPMSIDEAFLDVSGMRRMSGTPEEIARRLRLEVRDKVGLPITVGVASTKFLAKVASGVAKPDGLCVVPVGGELAFLHPLPVERLWGVGPVTAAALNAKGIFRVEQVAALPRDALVRIVGRAAGAHLHALALNRDPRRVRRGGGRRSFGAQSAFPSGTHAPDALDPVLMGLVDRVTRRMRAKGRVGRTITLRLRFGDFRRATRSLTLPLPTSQTGCVLAHARELLAASMPLISERGITLVGVAVSNLNATPEQLVLPLEEHDDPLDVLVDRVRERFGADAITWAALIGQRPMDVTWLTPDGGD